MSIITQFNFIGQGGLVAVNTKELAEQTYKDLQKRKAEKERQRESEVLSYYKYRKEKSRDVRTWYGKRIR